jgi:hypothetical protein
MTSAPRKDQLLAAGLAARLLHDLSGPAAGVWSGLDLLAEAAGVGDPALELAIASGRTLLDLIEFQRLAFGATGEILTGEGLKRLAGAPFEGRPRLDWAVSIEPLPALAAQAMLILVQEAAGGLALGGAARATASLSGAELVIRVDGEGPRASLWPETLEGLEGRDLSRGLAGRWAPLRYLSALVADAGGGLAATTGPDRFGLIVTLPVGGAF